jgi:hypothetical protein
MRPSPASSPGSDSGFAPRRRATPLAPASLLAEAHLHRGARDPGILELRAAASPFDRLGATLDSRRTGRRLAELSID